MPGAILNPQVDGLGAWMQFHPNQDAQLYYDAINKGYKYGGGDNWTGSGVPQNDFEQKALNGGVPGATLNKPGTTGGYPLPPGMSVTGGSSAFSTSGAGGYPGFDAQADKWRYDMGQIRSRGMMELNDDLASRGIFSGGTGAKLASDKSTGYDLQEAEGLEKMYGDYYRQMLGFQLEQERNSMMNQPGPQNSQSFGSGQNAAAMQAASQMYGGTSAPGYPTGPMGQTFGPSSGSGGQPPSSSTGSSDPRGKGSLELARAYYQATGKYGVASDHNAWANATYGYTSGDPAVPFKPIG